MKSKSKYKSILYYPNQRICGSCGQSAKITNLLKSLLNVSLEESSTCVAFAVWYTGSMD